MAEVLTNGEIEKPEELIPWAERGTLLRRVKRGKVRDYEHVAIEGKKFLKYFSSYWFKILPNKLRAVPLSDLLEVRAGYHSDNLHRASKKYEFQEAAPESQCFSVIFTHEKFLHKSVDFAADSKLAAVQNAHMGQIHNDEHMRRHDFCAHTFSEDHRNGHRRPSALMIWTRDRWVALLSHLISIERTQRVHFNETAWLIDKFHQADVNRNGFLSFDEVWNLLKKLNLQISERYAKAIFQDAEIERDNMLNEKEFLNFFERLTDRPDLRWVLQMASGDGAETITASELLTFLREEQHFKDVDLKKAESILETYEQTQGNQKQKLMGMMGMRRLMQSRWANIIYPGHEGEFQDMNQPLTHYFVNSSHNTYLTGLQVKGEATVEGYIGALRKGARLLELDLFDGENGEPVITHKRTFIDSITLRNTLQAIKRCAFDSSPYPVIMTLENHVGLVQQKVMADLFEEILGDQLYKPPRDSGRIELPSPSQLKHKFLLRGKKIFTSDEVEDNDEDDSPTDKEKTPKARIPIDPTLSALIALPSVKLSSNVYKDINEHPMDGSPSLSETKVETFFCSQAPIAVYTKDRFVKSYPKGLRQDSSNMHPVTSWLCGIQSVAMNFQTAGEELDLNAGFFRINNNCGYVLKPKILLNGYDPRTLIKPKIRLGVGIFSAQYLPKSEPGKDIIDPYVSVQIFGIPKDEKKVKSRVIKDNGFNPEWRDNFSFDLCCPELAVVRFCIKDFDSTSSNDFVGEYSIPVSSIREGYSQIRLNTGYQHTVDPSATIFVRIAIDQLN